MKLPIRSFLTASPEKVLLEFDFSQAEAWVVAYLANCREMKAALVRKGDKDIHSTSGRALFSIPEDAPISSDARYMGKKFNHASNYGTSPMMIAHMVNSESINPPYTTITIAQAKTYHQRWKDLFHEIPRWWLDIQRELSDSRTLKTPYGRERVFYGQWGDSLFKEAYAYIPQSTVADHCLGAVQPEVGIKGGIRGIFKEFVKGRISSGRPEIALLNTSHDSLILECPNSISKEVQETCVNLLQRPLQIGGETFTIPVDCKIGHAWGELEKC